MQFQVLTAPPGPGLAGTARAPSSRRRPATAYKQLLGGFADFRRCFPAFICFPHVVPTDEVVCLKMFHREDEPLIRLFLDDEQKRRLDRLWEEHRFISRQPVAEYKYLPQFIGFVTQDHAEGGPGVLRRPARPFRKRAEEFEKDVEAAIPKQLTALLDFAAQAYRRPLPEKEKTDLLGLYQTLRKKGVPHEEAFRGVLARMLVSPAFLFRIEQAPPGKKPGRSTTGNWRPGSATSSGRRRRTTSCAGSPRPASSATRKSWPSRRGGCSRTSASGRWPSSSARNGFTSAASTS